MEFVDCTGVYGTYIDGSVEVYVSSADSIMRIYFHDITVEDEHGRRWNHTGGWKWLGYGDTDYTNDSLVYLYEGSGGLVHQLENGSVDTDGNGLVKGIEGTYYPPRTPAVSP